MKNSILRKAKLRLTLLAAIPLLMGLTSCQQEEDFAPLGGEAQEICVAFTTDAIKTRVNPLEGGNVWENGDELYFCRISNDKWTKYSLTATVVNEVATWTPSDNLFWDGKGEHSLIVNYPCNFGLGWDDFAISDDQSTLENLKKADCMNARWAGTPTTETINFNLKHRLSMVTVNYIFASEFKEEPDMTPDIYSKARVVTFTDKVDLPMLTSVGIIDVWVKAYKHEELDAYENVVAKKFTAIVSPDAYAAGDEFIRVTIDGQVLTAKMKEDITFAEGTHYTFNLKVGKDKVTIEKTTIGNDIPGWDNDSEEDLN